MMLKNKRHIIIPIAIVVYTIVIAIYYRVKSYTSESRSAFFFIIGVNLILAIILYFILKKRENLRNNNKE